MPSIPKFAARHESCAEQRTTIFILHKAGLVISISFVDNHQTAKTEGKGVCTDLHVRAFGQVSGEVESTNDAALSTLEVRPKPNERGFKTL